MPKLVLHPFVNKGNNVFHYSQLSCRRRYSVFLSLASQGTNVVCLRFSRTVLCACLQLCLRSTSTQSEQPTSCFPNTATPLNSCSSAASRRFSKALATAVYHLCAPYSTLPRHSKWSILQSWGHTSSAAPKPDSVSISVFISSVPSLRTLLYPCSPALVC